MSRTALHRTITADLAGEIRSGAWPPGHRIPIEHELMVRYGCARATVSKAVHALAAQGLVERRRKAGTFVAQAHIQSAVLQIPDIAAEIAARGQAYRWIRLGWRIRRGPTDADAAGLGPVGALLEVSGLHLANAQRFGLEHRLINLAEVPNAADEDFAATIILGLIHFPAAAKPGHVPIETIRNLALVYVPIMVFLYGLSLALMFGYKITRASHAETLTLLAAKAEAVSGDPSQRLA